MKLIILIGEELLKLSSFSVNINNSHPMGTMSTMSGLDNSYFKINQPIVEVSIKKSTKLDNILTKWMEYRSGLKCEYTKDVFITDMKNHIYHYRHTFPSEITEEEGVVNIELISDYSTYYSFADRIDTIPNLKRIYREERLSTLLDY